MARAHAASACAKSDSIKGLAQSLAKTDLSPSADRRARSAPRRAHPHHRLPRHDLHRRLRPGGRAAPHRSSTPPNATSPRSRISWPSASSRLGRAGSRRPHRATAEPRHGADLGFRQRPSRPVCRRDQRIVARIPPKPVSADRPRCSTCSAPPIRSPPPAARASYRNRTSERRRRARDIALVRGLPGQVIIIQECALWRRNGAVGHAVGDNGLRRPDPRLCLLLAVDPRPRGGPDQ